jgi:hypothetical protein
MSGIVRITANERLFLATCALSGSASTKELAKRSGLEEHIVRYARESLLEQGAIKPVWQVDPYILGFLEVATYFNRGSESSKGRAALEQKLFPVPGLLFPVPGATFSPSRNSNFSIFSAFARNLFGRLPNCHASTG